MTEFHPGDVVRMGSGRPTYQVARLVRPGVADLVPAPGRADSSWRCWYQVGFDRLKLVYREVTPTPDSCKLETHPTERNVMARTVKVPLNIMLTVNVDDWAAEYSIDPAASVVRPDVVSYFNEEDVAAALIPEHLQGIVTVEFR